MHGPNVTHGGSEILQNTDDVHSNHCFFSKALHFPGTLFSSPQTKPQTTLQTSPQISFEASFQINFHLRISFHANNTFLQQCQTSKLLRKQDNMYAIKRKSKKQSTQGANKLTKQQTRKQTNKQSSKQAMTKAMSRSEADKW